MVDTIQSAMVKLDQAESGGTLLENLKFKGISPASDSEWDDIRSMNLQLLDDLINPAP